MRMAMANIVPTGRGELDGVSPATDHVFTGRDTAEHLDVLPVNDTGLHRATRKGFAAALDVDHLLASVINQG